MAAETESRHHLSRTYSGPLPDRPRSSASNASTSSDTQPNTPPYGASMSRRAGGLQGPPVLEAMTNAAVSSPHPNAPALSGVVPGCRVKRLQSCKTVMPEAHVQGRRLGRAFSKAGMAACWGLRALRQMRMAQ